MAEITRRQGCASVKLALMVVVVVAGLAGAVRPARAVDCSVDADCDACAGEVCFRHPNVPNGLCAPAHAPITCDDGDVCTVDACVPTTGTCTHAHVDGCCNTNVDCNVCTGLGCRTDAHRCGLTSTALDCSDADVCTADTCDPATGTCHHDDVASCCHVGDDAACADTDACTVDTCTDANVCAHPRALGIAGVQCLCEQLPAACEGVRMPARVARRFTRACTNVARAAQLSRPRRQRHFLGKASRSFHRAARASIRSRKRHLPPACRIALGGLFGTAQGRTDELRH